MENTENIFNPSELLPSDVCVRSAGTHLYYIGLSHFSIGSKKRRKIHNPLLIALANWMILLKSLISLLLPDENPEYFVIIADYSYFIKARIHYNMSLIITLLLTFISQYLHYRNYRNNKFPTYLKPFEMISGLTSPLSVGLTDKVKIYKFVKLSKQSFFVCELFMKYCIPVSSFSFHSIPMIWNCSLKQLIIFVFPINIILTYSIYSIYNILLYQILYFFLICYYLSLRAQQINEKINLIIKNKIKLNHTILIKMIRSFDSLYSTINHYNKEIWSKYLFWIWALFATLITTSICFGMFSNMNFILKAIYLSLGSFIFALVLLLIIISASSVNLETNKTYVLFYSTIFSTKKLYLSRSMRIKV